jgi:hypothetical protein
MQVFGFVYNSDQSFECRLKKKDGLPLLFHKDEIPDRELKRSRNDPVY